MMVVWVFYVLPLLTGIALSPLASGIVALSLNVAAFVTEVHGADPHRGRGHLLSARVPAVHFIFIN
jgi:ABC-type arginine transport system permease subunit